MRNWLFGIIIWPIFNIVSKLDYRRHPSTLRWVPDWLRYGCDFSLGPMKHSALLQPSTAEIQPELKCTVVQWSAPSFWVHLLIVCCTGRCTKKKNKSSCLFFVESWITFLLYGYWTSQCTTRSHHSYVFVGVLRRRNIVIEMDCHPPLNWDQSQAGLCKWTMIWYEYAGQWASSAKKKKRAGWDILPQSQESVAPADESMCLFRCL